MQNRTGAAIGMLIECLLGREEGDFLMRVEHALRRRAGLRLALVLASGVAGSLAFAQERHEESTNDLAKAAQNPISDVISLPLQNNFNFGVGPRNQLQYILNVQPVVPITLDHDWNLITRWITPIISQPPLSV